MARKVLGLSGSLRKESFNSKLLRNFLTALEKEGGFETRALTDLNLPFINEDIETKPLHPSLIEFRTALQESQIVVIASPEYNASLSPVLKNAIDWGTRPSGTNFWAGKLVVLLSASPGALGGARGLIHLRTVVSGVKAWVIPEQVQCPQAHQAFDGEGLLKVEAVQKQMSGAIASLKALAQKML